MSLADLDRWDPDEIHSVFEAATARAEHTRTAATNIGDVFAAVPGEGQAHDAAQQATGRITDDLMNHADRVDAVGRAAAMAEHEVRGIKSVWHTLLRTASNEGFTIDLATNEISYVPPADPQLAARKALVFDGLHAAIEELLARANAADAELADAIRAVSGAQSPTEVQRDLDARAASAAPGSGQRSIPPTGAPGGQNGSAQSSGPSTLEDLNRANDQAVLDGMARVKAAKKAIDDAAAQAATNNPGSPETEAALARLPQLKQNLAQALDEVGKIPDYSKVDPSAVSVGPDGHLLFPTGGAQQVFGTLKNGTGEIFDQSKLAYYTYKDGKLTGTRFLDEGSAVATPEPLLTAVTAATGVGPLAKGGEGAWLGLRALFSREGADALGGLTGDNVLGHASDLAAARSASALDDLAAHRPGSALADSLPLATDHAPPIPASVADHPAPVDMRGHPSAGGVGEQPITNPAPDGLDHHLEIGPMPPQSVDDIEQWLPEINHGPGMDPFDPARGVNCGDCAAAVHHRLFGDVPDATAGLDTLSMPEMEAATGLKQVAGTPAEIERYLIDQGPGAHTVIGVDRAGAPGHWFNAYYDGQNVYAVDAQTGEIMGWPPNMDGPGFPVTNWDYGVPK